MKCVSSEKSLRSYRASFTIALRIKADQGRKARETATQDAKALADRATAAAAEHETVRRGAWLDALLTEAIDSGKGETPITELLERIPAKVWPPGISPSDFALPGGPAINDASAFEGTFMGSLAKAKNIKFGA
jgi:hypothetical protein